MWTLLGLSVSSPAGCFLIFFFFSELSLVGALLLSHFSHFPSFCILCMPSCSAFLDHSLPAVSYLFSPAGPSQETAPFFTSALMFVWVFFLSFLRRTRKVSLHDPMHTHLSLSFFFQYSSVLQSVKICLQLCIPPNTFEWVCISLWGCCVDVHLSFSQWDIRDNSTVFYGRSIYVNLNFRCFLPF